VPIAEVVETSDGQTIRIPNEFRFATDIVSIRKDGDAVILEPAKPSQWPKNFFEQIRIDDPAFVRPDQGSLPPAPTLE
jgi:virulence-associated protein VagC